MAAAVLSRSRGVAGVRTTKGLFFIFTLLSLLCVASSLLDKNQLIKAKVHLQKEHQQMDNLKARLATTSEHMSEFRSHMNAMIASVNKITKTSSDFLPLDRFLEHMVGFVEKTNVYVAVHNEMLDAEKEKAEHKLGETEDAINFIERHQDEL